MSHLCFIELLALATGKHFLFLFVFCITLYLLLLHEIGSELSVGENASSDKLAPRMDFAMHCRKGLWLLCRKKVFPLEFVFLLLRLHVCVPKPTMKLKLLQITS